MQKEYELLLGLSNYEIDILNTLQNKTLSVSDVARVSGIPRTTLLPILRQLKKRNLTTTIQVGKRKKWAATPSNVLGESLVRFGKKLSNTSTGYTDVIHTSKDSEIMVHKGKEAIFKIWNHFAHMPKHTRVHSIQPDKSYRLAIKKDFDAVVKTNELIRKNKVIVEGIVSEASVDTIPTEVGKEKSKKIFESFFGRLADTVKLPPEFLNIEAEMYSDSDTVYITNWKDEIAISIKDKDVLALFLGLFDALKFLCKKYDQHEKMARKIVNLE